MNTTERSVKRSRRRSNQILLDQVLDAAGREPLAGILLRLLLSLFNELWKDMVTGADFRAGGGVKGLKV
jgi:hypothetical protein